MIRTRIFVLAMWLAPAPVMAEDRPLALVEHVAAPAAEISAFDYLYDDDKIDLRPDGELRIAYFDSCVVETITGGVVKLNKDKEAKVSKGGVTKRETRPCQTAALALSDESKEAAAAVKRVSPFGEEWREISIATATPRFVWPYEDEEVAATVSVYLLEAQPAELVWQGEAAENSLAYPEDAPALETGLPYRVAVTVGGKEISAAVFSIDPGLEMPEGVLTTAVPLGL